MTQLKFADGRTISDIKQNSRGEVISATMPDGSKLVPNIRQNQGLVNGTHQDGYNLVVPDGTSASMDATGGGSTINTNFTTHSGQMYFNHAERPPRN